MWPWGTIGYVVVALVWWRMLGGWIAWEGFEERSDPEPDWGLGVGLGLIGAVIWPITITLCLASWAWTSTSARWPLVIGAERARRRFEREQAEVEQRHRDLRQARIDSGKTSP
jgi:hypothetical protein